MEKVQKQAAILLQFLRSAAETHSTDSLGAAPKLIALDTETDFEVCS